MTDTDDDNYYTKDRNNLGYDKGGNGIYIIKKGMYQLISLTVNFGKSFFHIYMLTTIIHQGVM